MVREKGMRMPDLSHMVLAEIADGEASDRTQFASFELPYYHLDSGTSAFETWAARGPFGQWCSTRVCSTTTGARE